MTSIQGLVSESEDERLEALQDVGGSSRVGDAVFQQVSAQREQVRCVVLREGVVGRLNGLLHLLRESEMFGQIDLMEHSVLDDLPAPPHAKV